MAVELPQPAVSVSVRAPRLSLAACLLLVALAPPDLLAGGPKFVAGVSYFNPAVLGQPIHWAGGQVNYYVDQGPLNSQISNQQATAMVDAAAALWSAVPTAAVSLADAGQLNEDVNGSNIIAASTVIAQPADVTPSAANYPLGIIYDADGTVTNAIFGAGAADPTSCQNNGVMTWLDNIQPDATIAHAIILLNGLCAATPDQLTMMSYRAGARFRPRSRPRLCPGQPRRALQRRSQRPFRMACDAAHQRPLLVGRRRLHSRPLLAAPR